MMGNGWSWMKSRNEKRRKVSGPTFPIYCKLLQQLIDPYIPLQHMVVYYTVLLTYQARSIVYR